ncbi:MCM family protein [Methanocaldococcus infernus ME]|uniref:DNA helicase n=1 Tax=Methanocaldococcus infernus (strain DSM 11812 / JCM 15783 / ME) TaxID=573063 RepID=D5VQL3_METIM|nr:minichromosome maintenance protein MCM [Methanocaldococcus infernus]ADG12866.1 MCM family protein [Methanocaldococcus infernus ME]
MEEFRDSLVEFLRNSYLNEIIEEEKEVTIDLNKLYLSGFMEVVEFIVNNPFDGLKFIEECYKEAYFILKSETLDEVKIKFKNIPKIFRGERFNIKDIGSKYINKLVEFEALIILASKRKPILKKAYYYCEKCGSSLKEEIDIFNFSEERVCKCGSIMKLIEDKSEFTDFQELKVQEPLDLLENPDEPPKYITVILENSPGIYAGRVRIVGVPIKIRKSKKLPVYDLVVKALSCEVLDGEVKIKLSKKDVEKIKKLAKRDDIIDILSDKLIPEIKGHSIIKKAIFLQQIKGVKKPGKRADIHILLITDPGIGKTVMLRKIAEIPGNIYGSITTATGVGLTAAVVKEKTEIGEESWVIKPGLLVKANKGTACIDELTVNRDILSYVLEAMESQTIHISKGGINAKLPAECSVLAACNPKYGRFDPDKSVSEQINIPAPLLSRFDLIFPLKDVPNKDEDREIAEYIVDLHRAYLDKEVSKKMGLEEFEVDGIKIDKDLLIKYIFYARALKPVISERAKELLINYYVNMRKKHQITARQIEAAIRIAEAHAKAKLKEEVDEEDVKVAINIITECLKEIAYDPEEGIYDIDKIVGMSRKDREKVEIVYNAIKELSKRNELVSYLSIVEMVKDKIKEEEIDSIIKRLIKYGDIDEPKPGRFRILE